jgi:[acyl-carrier-protein] S-malonyltransferase
VIPLKVSAPFHCALMAPAARAVATALKDIHVAPLAFPVVANVDALPNADAARVADLLVRQVDSPVRWQQSVEWMAATGFERALELGPGKVLAGLVKRIAKDLKVHSAGDPETLSKAKDFLA